jgi:hypothetical protein
MNMALNTYGKYILYIFLWSLIGCYYSKSVDSTHLCRIVN